MTGTLARLSVGAQAPDYPGWRTFETSDSTRFNGAGSLDRPLDALTEVLRETRRILFMRGLVVQEGATIASFSASVRKFEAR